MNGVTWTDAQARALQPGGKLVLAGAGSGKSTVLVERYLQLLGDPDSGIEPRHVVAMTFSRKAAANLQAKIHRELFKREREDRDHADHWRAQRERMPWAMIGTIHSICGRLLRAWPLDAGVDPDFTVAGDGGADLADRVHQHVRRLAYTHDPDLAFLLGTLDRAEHIEELVVALASRPELAGAVRYATGHPGEAVAWLDGALPALAAAHHLPEMERPDPSFIDHTPYVEALGHLLTVAEPLLPRPDAAAVDLAYDDLERYALRLLEQGGPAARAIRASIRHLLVDEFQDTSSRQWRLIRALATDNDGLLQPDKLFLVGDAKQSIYGFREADVTVVHQAAAEWRAVDPDEARWSVKLNDNFRTLKGVVDPLNAAFDTMLRPKGSERLPFEAEPEALVAKRPAPDGVDARVEVVAAMTDKLPDTFGWLAKKLREEVESGSIDVGDAEDNDAAPHRLTYDDIGILFQTRTVLAALEDALRSEGIPYTVVKGGGFFDRQEILDLLHLVAALADPRDALALVGVLRSPLFTLSDPVVAALFLHGDDPHATWRKLAAGDEEVADLAGKLSDDELASLREAFALWRHLEEVAAHSTPADLVLTALEARGAWAAYATGRRGDQRLANLYQFLDLIRGQVAEGHYTLRRLNDRLQQLRDQADPELDVEADVHGGRGVRVMTMHASKGLEFPYVVNLLKPTGPRRTGIGDLGRGHLLVPPEPYGLHHLAAPALGRFADAASPEGTQVLHRWMYQVFEPAEEAAEQVRLLYVAATRARDRLLLLGNVPTKKGEIALKAGSPSAVWLEALGVEVGEDGTLVPPEDPAVVWRELHEGELVAVTPPSDRGMALEEAELPEEPVDDPQVRLMTAPPPDAWTLPITAFAAYLADGSPDALRELVWYAASGLEPGEVEGEEGAEAPVREGAALDANRFASAVGDLVHRLYQAHGPGCGWVEVESDVEAELAGWKAIGLDPEKGRARIYALLEAGRRMGLAEYPSTARREVPILLRFGEVTLRGRADLAWREGDQAVAVDYKTNDIPADAVDEIAVKHGYDHQAKLYALALARAWGLPRAECRLVFLGAEKELRWTVALDDEATYRAAADALGPAWQALETTIAVENGVEE